MKSLNIHEIIEFLPHRYPFLMIDKIIDHDDNWLHAVKNVTMNEPYFTGHFPDNPVMPGVMITEAIAQAGAVLAYIKAKSTPKQDIFYLAGVNNARFKQMVIPGDQLNIEVRITGNKGQFWKLEGEAKVDGKVACSLELLSAMRKVDS